MRKFSNKRLNTDGNYRTAEVDTPRSANTRLSMEGNYSTVDEDTPQYPNKRLSMEGNYSTVDEDTPKYPNDRLSVEGDYCTVDEDMPKISNNRLSVDGNYSTVELDEQLEGNCRYPENSEQGNLKPTIKPKPKSSCINSANNRSPDQNIKHITHPNGSDNVYAIVDKSCKNVPTANGGKGEVTCQPDQIYAVVDKAWTHKSSPDETNKNKFEINSGNWV